jgi:hypothetical protein
LLQTYYVVIPWGKVQNDMRHNNSLQSFYYRLLWSINQCVKPPGILRRMALQISKKLSSFERKLCLLWHQLLRWTQSCRAVNTTSLLLFACENVSSNSNILLQYVDRSNKNSLTANRMYTSKTSGWIDSSNLALVCVTSPRQKISSATTPRLRMTDQLTISAIFGGLNFNEIMF